MINDLGRHPRVALSVVACPLTSLSFAFPSTARLTTDALDPVDSSPFQCTSNSPSLLSPSISRHDLFLFESIHAQPGMTDGPGLMALGSSSPLLSLPVPLLQLCLSHLTLYDVLIEVTHVSRHLPVQPPTF